MDRIGADLRRIKAEPKNYIALNRKKICTKKSNPTQKPLNPHKSSIGMDLTGRRQRPEVTPSDIKRSIEQLASIISKGDLDKILQLAKEVKSNRPEQQPSHLPSVPESVSEHQTRPVETRTVKVVQPRSVPGLDGESEDKLTRDLGSDAPIVTTEIEPLPPTLQATSITPRVEPHYGRGQGLRQLLELDGTGSVPKSHAAGCVRERPDRRERLEEGECYYPWGKPGAGAPMRSYTGGITVQRQDDMATQLTKGDPSSQQQSAPSKYVRLDAEQKADYAEPTNPIEEKKRRALQYMLELQAQVREKERARREQQERQSRADRLEDERIERERERLLLEAEKEKERIAQRKKEARQRFQFLQAKIEEQHQMALRNRRHRINRHTTSPPSHAVSPLSTQSANADAKSDTTFTTVESIQSPKPHRKESVNVKGKSKAVHNPKVPEDRNASTHKRKSVQQGRVRNPPPNHLSVLKPGSRTHQLARDKKSASMPSIARGQLETGADESCSDLSKTSTLISLDRTASLTNVCTDPRNTYVKPQPYKEMCSGEKNQNVISQLQKLKQGLYMKQQELHSELF